MSSLVCSQTGARYAVDEPRWQSDVGAVLDLEFTPQLDRAAVASRPATLWRYREALPIERDEHIVTLGEGLTPLVEADFAGRRVLLKQDQLFPTGSFKDRGASVLLSKVRELGVQRVIEDSSGNAGAAIAAYAARAGVECEIYVPEKASPAKLRQIEAYGAKLYRVEGSRADIAMIAEVSAKRTYYASHVWNPFFLHGTKTVAYEIAEQLGWRSPDVVVMPVGNGTLLLGAHIGFRELHEMGVIERVPRLVGVQAANCAPLAAAWSAGAADVAAVDARATVAEGIAIPKPRRGAQILAAVRETGGQCVAVSDDATQRAKAELAARGIYVEPTCATAVAGLAEVPAGGTVVVVLTGHGLKSA